MEQPTRFVGLDVHKETIVAAVIEAAAGKATSLGTIPNSVAALEKLAARLRAGGGALKFCYEAGPCGYGVHRTLTRLGLACDVVAPSLIPRRAGDRQKTDKRDAAALALLDRAARLAGVRAVRTARQQLSAFLLRHERIYAQGKTPWTKAHRGWLADQRFDLPVHRLVLEESIEAVRMAEQRRDRVEAHLRAAIPDWSLADLVRNLSALRGLDTIGAAGQAAAIGDASRFPSAPAFMAYLGLVPSEQSSGPKRRLGGITKSGDIHARTMLIEAAWSYRFPARIARAKLAAVEAVAEPVREIAWKAQVRLCRRYREMMLAGKPKQVVVTAIARELAGFVWAIARVTAGLPAEGTATGSPDVSPDVCLGDAHAPFHTGVAERRRVRNKEAGRAYDRKSVLLDRQAAPPGCPEPGGAGGRPQGRSAPPSAVASRKSEAIPRLRRGKLLTAAARTAKGKSGRDEKTAPQPNQKTNGTAADQRRPRACQKVDILPRRPPDAPGVRTIRQARRGAGPVRATLGPALEPDFRFKTEAGPRRTMVLRYPTRASQHDRPSLSPRPPPYLPASGQSAEEEKPRTKNRGQRG